MSLRTFVDHSGTEWEVFEVHPGTAGRARTHVPEEFLGGWLCFQSPLERRRLAPIPDDWEAWDDQSLERALSNTQGIPRRTPPSFEAQVTPTSHRNSGESSAFA